MKYIEALVTLFFLVSTARSQGPKPDFKSTVQYIGDQVNRNSTDSAVFTAAEDGSFSIGDKRSNFYYLCKPKIIDKKQSCDSLEKAFAIKKDGAYYHLLMYKPHEEYFATFRDYQYAALTLKALVHLMTLCKPPQDPF